MADAPKVRTLDEALGWLDGLERAGEARGTGQWPLASVLDHLAQSIEMSMDGFPEAKPLFFQRTVGAAAFAVFKLRGRMSHGLAAAIPGAPPLASGPDWRAPAARLRRAILRFQQHAGALRPHFAYGALSKSDFALAHAMHIANHQDEIVRA
ncbi:MAG TPA: DUF1569 domain-containing protein [Ramlibacter sp.]|uniref:DUF1569 domain-containing protein n=1 Tax=Ramlibacter sp. TaxID=1917967 RepID=UPI002C35495A|nr:DUF1569 domain-containing protein [Ramlibacter sp.]HVZ43321.1 DUF1569 domain-containing protein [Ramlibacter sp.]